MKLNPFKWGRNKKSVYEATCSPIRQVQRQSLIDFLLGNRHYDLAFYKIIQYYCIVAPLSDGTDRIAEGVGGITPLIYDKKEQSFVKDHSLQLRLDNPNFDMDWNAFAIAYSSFLILTGNSFFIANSVGDMNTEPRALFIIHPQDVTINQTNGIITSYDVNEDGIQINYKLVKSIQGKSIRYINEQDSLISELFHSKNFNPMAANFGIIGKSKLNSVYYEVEQYISQSIHNLSKMKRGVTLDGVLKHEKTLTQDQLQTLKAELDAYYSSEMNSGRILVLQNGIDYVPNGKRFKDMDFEELTKHIKETIYNRLKIPLPTVSSETMTMANMDAAALLKYDDAILPATNFLMSQLTKFLMPRYKNSENLKVWYDDGDISALEPRRNEQLQAKKSLSIYTINELRTMDRATGLDGGDNLYGQATEVPIATDTEGEFADSDFNNGNGNQQDQKPTPDQEDQEDQRTDDTAKFIGLLKSYKDMDGKPLFSEEEVVAHASNFAKNK